jgi:hypothetical protein
MFKSRAQWKTELTLSPPLPESTQIRCGYKSKICLSSGINSHECLLICIHGHLLVIIISATFRYCIYSFNLFDCTESYLGPSCVCETCLFVLIIQE